MRMPGTMDKLAADLASGKIKIHEEQHSPEKKKLALLAKTHDTESSRHAKAASEAMELSKHHRSRGEHELAELHKKIVEPLQKAASLHKELAKYYNKRHGE